MRAQQLHDGRPRMCAFIRDCRPMDLEVILARDEPCRIDSVCLHDRGEHVERRIWRDVVDGHPERYLIDVQLPRDGLKVPNVQRRDETADASGDGLRGGAGFVHRGRRRNLHASNHVFIITARIWVARSLLDALPPSTERTLELNGQRRAGGRLPARLIAGSE